LLIEKGGRVLIQVDVRSRTPIFEQIKNQITELVITGALKPHDQVPSIRGLAHDLSLNFNTVKRAYADLEQAGVIYTLTGRGSFVAETAVDNTRLKARAFEGIVTALKIGRANGIAKEDVIEAANGIYGDGEP
jgi:GntR family transcriptional regulator